MKKFFENAVSLLLRILRSFGFFFGALKVACVKSVRSFDTRAFRRKPKLTPQEFVKEMHTKSKSEIIKNIIATAGDVNRDGILKNRNYGYIDKEYRKELRSHSKRQLIRTLTMLKVLENKKMKKLYDQVGEVANAK